MGRNNLKKTTTTTAADATSSRSNGSSGGGNDTTIENLLQDMEIGKVIYAQDVNALIPILEKIILRNTNNTNTNNDDDVSISNVTIEKSMGEAFTGGRSTPVYYISAKVHRRKCVSGAKVHRRKCVSGAGTQQQQQVVEVIKERKFCIKLVLLPSSSSSTTTSHIVQKRESYAVERRFYEYIAPYLRTIGDGNNNGLLTIPKLLASDRDADSRPWPSQCFVMNDLRIQYPIHPIFLNVSQVYSALLWVAKFHAIFWGGTTTTTTSSNGSSNGEYHGSYPSSWRKQVWDHGGFSTKEDRIPNDTSTTITKNWIGTIRYLQLKYPEYITATTTTKGLGQRIQALAGPLVTYFRQEAKSSSKGTLLHGDYKAANLFFKIQQQEGGSSTAESSSSSSEVAVVDFQYTGSGISAEDIAYLLFPDANGHYFEYENELLQFYYQQLIEQLILQCKGGPSSLSWNMFIAYYQLSRINLLRYWIEKHGWIASTKGDVLLISSIEETMNHLDGGSILTSEEDYQAAIENFVLTHIATKTTTE